MTVSLFGTMPDGRPVSLIRLGHAPGIVLDVLTLGAAVHRLEVPGRDGVRRDVVLALPTVEAYLASGDYLGGTIGRYANRIAQGRFRLADREVVLATNDRGNTLHGGPDGFNRRLWDIVEHGEDHLVLGLTSPDGDTGFPGTLQVRVVYRIVGDTVHVEHTATTDAATIVNLTNHAYFNLDGAGRGTIDDHELLVAAEAYTPVDETGIPLGEHQSVDGTPFDLRTPRRLGDVVRDRHPQIALGPGIDHNYVLSPAAGAAAVLTSQRSGLRLTVRTDQPGLQVYTGNFLDGRTLSPAGRRYRQGDGIALEPQLFPDTPHHPAWPSAILEPGQTYRCSIAWEFAGTE